MNKNYVAPLIEVIEIKLEGLLCASTEPAVTNNFETIENGTEW